MHLAVITRQHKVVQYLLKASANPLVSDRNGDTPLHLACKYGFLQGIIPLLNRTTRINTEGCRIPELVMRNNDGKCITKYSDWLRDGDDNTCTVHMYMYMHAYCVYIYMCLREEE